MKPWIIILIVFVAILAIGISVYLYQSQRTKQQEIDAQKLALIYGGLAQTKQISPFKDFLTGIFGSLFGGATGLLNSPGGQVGLNGILKATI